MNDLQTQIEMLAFEARLTNRLLTKIRDQLPELIDEKDLYDYF